MVLGALSRTSTSADIHTIGINYLRWVIERYEETGTVWEKYLAVPDAAEQVERYGTVSFYGWSCASVVQIGRVVGLDS